MAVTRAGRTRVEAVEALAGGAAVDAVALNQAHEDDLAAEDGEDALRMHEVGVAKVVQAALLEDLGTCATRTNVSAVRVRICANCTAERTHASS